MTRCCFAPGCRSGLQTEVRDRKVAGLKPKAIFTAPKDPELFKLWQKAVPRADRCLSSNDILCEDHFRKEDIIKLYSVDYPKETVWYKYQRARLKPGSIPIYFNVPGYNNHLAEKIYAKRRYLPCKEKWKVKQVIKISQDNKVSKPSDNESNSKLVEEMSILSNENSFEDISCLSPIDHSSETSLDENAIEGSMSSVSSIIDECTSEKPGEVASVKISPPSENFPHPFLETVLKNSLSNKSQQVFFVKNVEGMKNVLHFLQKGKRTFPSEPQEMPFVENSDNVISDSVNLDADLECLDESQFVPDCVSENDSRKNEVLPKPLSEEQITYNFLKENLHVIEKETPWWSINGLENYIVCARWDSNYEIDRKIIIKNDLTVKVFLENKESKIGIDLKVRSLETISRLIYRVERTIVCPKIHLNVGKCDGFLQGSYSCRKKNLCRSCINWEKEKAIEEKQRQREEKKKLQGHVELMRFNFNQDYFS